MPEFRSIGMTLVGAALLLVALAVLAVNEENVLTYRQAALRHGGMVVDATGTGPSDANNGEMVRVTGTPEVTIPPHDRDFGIHADAPMLWRTVEMYQWKQTDYAGQVGYEMDWFDHPVDWTIFRHPGHHHNPPSLPFGSARFVAAGMRLDGFELSPPIIDAMPGRVAYTPDFSSLFPNLAASFRQVGGKLLTSEDLASPQLGDLRVSWTVAPLQTVTVIARNRDGVLMPARGLVNEPGFALQVGNHPVVDLQPDLPPEPLLPWVWRVLALLTAGAGMHMLLRGVSPGRREVQAAVTLALTLTCGLAGVMWIVAVPTAGAVLVAVAVLALVLTAWRLYERAP